MIRLTASLMLALSLATLTGCGQMGPLYIPVEEEQAEPAGASPEAAQETPEDPAGNSDADAAP